MDIFAFSRTINLFLLVSTNDKALANVKGVNYINLLTFIIFFANLFLRYHHPFVP